MSTLKFTRSQQEAIETLDRNVSVSAGAGSGKTAVLVERFCRIVENRLAKVDEILTVTFTEKAAKEMKERIVQRFEKHYEDTKDPRFEEARRSVESAYIGTIHSFASRLLRENSFEAGVDPKFSLLADAEAETIKDNVLEELIAIEYEKGTKEYLDLAYAFGKDSIKHGVKKLHSHLASLGKEVSDIGHAQLVSANPQALADQYFEIIEQLLAQLYSGKLTDAFAERLKEFAQKYEPLKSKMMEASCWLLISDPEKYFLTFDWDVFNELTYIANFVPGNVGSKEVKENYVKPAKETAKQFLDTLIQPMANYYVNCLKKVTQDFRCAYWEAKKRVGALDFDDLLLTARDLLIKPDGTCTQIAEDYLNKFKFVVMDEFQDTNSLQKSIVQAVTQPDRFFTVGDIKQSIFGFIHSDVDVFREHHDAIKKGKGVGLAFQENFRSRPDIIGFVNWLFARLWEEDQDFEFEELEAKGLFHDRPGTDVELLFIQKNGSTDECRLQEARAIANRINQLLGINGDKPFQVTKKKDENGKPRDLKPGDIMLLFRATKSIPLYERVLNEAGIDCYVVSGRGFYSTHEVQDILNLLRVVENPMDDVAMAGVLRSPMVSISDDALWWLTRSHNEVEFDENSEDESYLPARNRNIGKLYSGLSQLEQIKELNETDREKLAKFWQTLAELHSIRSDSRITRLLDKAISDTQYDLKLLASVSGKRKFANIGKLLDIAQGFETSRLFSLADFIRYIENMMVVGERESEAATETEDSSVVRLMTVHKAKGLQAPVVIVADCSREPRDSDRSPFKVGKNTGIACRLKNPLTDEWVETDAYKSVSDSLKNKDIREEKRLLYVAATRAEELLIISGYCDYKGRKIEKKTYSEISSWAGWVEKAFDIDSSPVNGIGNLAAGDVPVLLNTGSSADITAVKRFPPALELYRDELMFGKSIPSKTDCLDIVKRCIAECSASGEDSLRLTVSRLLAYLECPRRYYLQWVLGVEDQTTKEQELPDETVSYSALDLGTAVHDVLAAVDFSQDIKTQVNDLVKHQNPVLRGLIISACDKLLSSPWLEKIKSAQERMQEVPFSARFDGFNLLGRIDLLFKSDSGWVVADYKTGAGVDKETYRMQVGLYALAVEKCLGVKLSDAVLIDLGNGSDSSMKVTPELTQHVYDLINKTAQDMIKGKFPEKKGPHCIYCNYKCRQASD